MARIPFSFLKSSGAVLPNAGPFAGLPITPVSSLSDRTISSNTAVTSNSLSAPLKYKHLTLTNFAQLGVDYSDSATAQIFIWVDQITLNVGTGISADGTQGDSASAGVNFAVGGLGGAGGSGGGGGGASYTGGGQQPGGPGGEGFNGTDGSAASGNCCTTVIQGGTAGPGFGLNNDHPYFFGNGSASPSGYSGGNGYGGGGSGGDGLDLSSCCGLVTSAGGGGGGGGSIVCLVCNWFEPFIADTSSVTAYGGAGGPGSGCNDGSPGGDGVVYIATKKLTSARFLAASSNIYFWEIKHDNTLVQRTDWQTATWDNT